MNKDKRNQVYLAIALVLIINVVFCCIEGNSVGAIAYKVTANGFLDLLMGLYIGTLIFSKEE